MSVYLCKLQKEKGAFNCNITKKESKPEFYTTHIVSGKSNEIITVNPYPPNDPKTIPTYLFKANEVMPYNFGGKSRRRRRRNRSTKRRQRKSRKMFSFI